MRAMGCLRRAALWSVRGAAAPQQSGENGRHRSELQLLVCITASIFRYTTSEHPIDFHFRRTKLLSKRGEALASVALIGWLVFFAVAAGWRSWLQWRRTGDTGFRGLAHPLGSTEQLAGIALVAGALVSASSPVLVLTGAIGTAGALTSPVIAALGLLVLAAGIGITLKAQLDMGASWRIGVDRTERTSLATQGLYRHARNPIYSGMLLAWLGEAVLVPNAVSLAGLLITFVAVEVFVRRIEEPYLLSVHGDAYRSYAHSVGRFVPGVGRFA
jgi:protein-S-isoprenylcysteine O-methyltransferase Ste14